MAQNRVIGHHGAIPWRLPEDLRWFKQATHGAAVLMGRKTFDSLRHPLPGRLNLVATRDGIVCDSLDVETVRDLAAFRPEDCAPREVWVIGGAEIYAQTLPRCAELYLSVLDRDAEGDTFFPEFESTFRFAEVVLQKPGFEVRRYLNTRVQS